MDSIRKEVERLFITHKTRNAFEIARRSEIIVIEENLGKIDGYFNDVDGVKFIHVNKKLFEIEKLVVCSNCLGQCILYTAKNPTIVRRYKKHRTKGNELDAYYFASCLIQHNFKKSDVENAKKLYGKIDDSLDFIDLRKGVD